MTETERETVKDRLEEVTLSKVEAAITSKTPIEFDKEDVELLRASFEDAGVEYDIGKAERASLVGAPMLRVKAALAEGGNVSDVLVYDYDKPKGQRWTKLHEFDESKFGDVKFEDDRSLGLYAMLGSEKFEELAKLSYEMAVNANYPGKIGGHKGTEGRGLLQAAADLLTISQFDAKKWGDDHLLEMLNYKLNKRLWKGFRKTSNGDEIHLIDQQFSKREIAEPTKITAGFPPEALPELIRFLAA